MITMYTICSCRLDLEYIYIYYNMVYCKRVVQLRAFIQKGIFFLNESSTLPNHVSVEQNS